MIRLNNVFAHRLALLLIVVAALVWGIARWGTLNLGNVLLLRAIFNPSPLVADSAEQLLQQASSGPLASDARRSLIRLYLAQGQPARAAAVGRQLQTSADDDPLAMFWLGQALWESGDKPAARQVWRESGAIRTRLQYLLGDGWQWAGLGDPLQAEKSFRQALDLDPTYGPAYDALASLWWGQRWEDVAWALEQAVIYLPPGTAEWYWSQARLAILAGDWPRAEQMLTATVALWPGEWPMRFLADVLGRLGQIDRQAEVQAEIDRRWGP